MELMYKLPEDITRKKAWEKESSFVALIDSQSVKTSRSGGVCRGVDRDRKIKGRKRPIHVDTLRLLLAVGVYTANA